MKISPAFQLIMQAIAKATAHKHFSLNLPHHPSERTAALQRKFKRSGPKPAPSTT